MQWRHAYHYWSVDVRAEADVQKQQMGEGLEALNKWGSEGWELVSVAVAPLGTWEWARVPRSEMEEFDYGRAEDPASFTRWIRYTAFWKKQLDAERD